MYSLALVTDIKAFVNIYSPVIPCFSSWQSRTAVQFLLSIAEDIKMFCWAHFLPNSPQKLAVNGRLSQFPEP